jgi:VanZ family protein
MKQLVKVLFWFACIAVAVLSLLPGEYLHSGAFDWWDKAQHALAFLVLCGLGLQAYSGRSTRVFLGLLAYGVLIELAQAATGWRYGDWQDWVADAVGILATYGLWLRLPLVREREI